MARGMGWEVGGWGSSLRTRCCICPWPARPSIGVCLPGSFLSYPCWAPNPPAGNRFREKSVLAAQSWLSPNSATPRTVACQAPLSMEFSRQEYWSGYPLLLQGIVPIQGLNPGLLQCRQILYHLNPQGNPSLPPNTPPYIPGGLPAN